MKPNSKKPAASKTEPPRPRHKRVLKKVLQVAKSRGLHIPRKPKDEIPPLPRDITKVSSSELGRLYQRFAAHQAYALAHAALADIEKTLLAHEVRIYAARFRVAEDDESAKWKIEDKMLTDDDYLAMDFLLQKATAYAQLLDAVVEGLAVKVQSLSREISRREQEFHGVGRV